MDSTPITLGEQMRRRRRERKWSLQRLADETGLSYTHLSRIENDSTVPNVATITKISAALDLDLAALLALNDRLPRVILDRLLEGNHGGAPTLQRRLFAAGVAGSEQNAGTIAELALRGGLDAAETAELGAVVADLVQLALPQRHAIYNLVHLLMGEAHDGAR